MHCLYCGDCCLRMSPKSSESCPDLIQDNTFYFCKNYERRPEDCINHNFPSKYCPIGLSKLGLKNTQEIVQRIDEGRKLIRESPIHCITINDLTVFINQSSTK